MPGESRRRWLTGLLSTSLGATIVSFLYPVLRYVVPPLASEPSLTEIELDVKASEIHPNWEPHRARSAENPSSSSGRRRASSRR